ncbi:enoyl-CoA hydratase/isomerase family protein [Sphingomonas immobilis]|uniref:Enoyl-CoA hydratase-related protein n=1 Tax=Sphingomonas immobilis TaxID=3063997 RepID=A0ABT8ZX33_9SPHN|nr:enoyl-CoA hydratase-related protein [Sphingomonas sp. CA1-15]MDO7842109.1 enoyl-CoA hydratase-related protein [Sphingomonas sp. CA1-15]
MPEYRNFLVERRDSVEIVTLNRPDVLNAVSPEFATELVDYFTRLHDRLDVRVVVLRAAGRGFCAGLDIKAWPLPEGEKMVVHMGRTQKMMGDIMRRMRTCPQPIIALGHGAACGAGFSMMLAADVRFGAPSLRMNAAYIKIGLGGCDIGSSYFLPRLVGVSIASELILTGRFIHADRALRVGLLSDVVAEEALLDTGLSLAAEMVANAPLGLRMSKEALNFNVDAQSLDAAMALEDRQQILLTATQDHVEAMQAFVEKRPPVYQGR